MSKDTFGGSRGSGFNVHDVSFRVVTAHAGRYNRTDHGNDRTEIATSRAHRVRHYPVHTKDKQELARNVQQRRGSHVSYEAVKDQELGLSFPSTNRKPFCAVAMDRHPRYRCFAGLRTLLKCQVLVEGR